MHSGQSSPLQSGSNPVTCPTSPNRIPSAVQSSSSPQKVNKKSEEESSGPFKSNILQREERLL